VPISLAVLTSSTPQKHLAGFTATRTVLPN
jgi:hypothetical protein